MTQEAGLMDNEIKKSPRGYARYSYGYSGPSAEELLRNRIRYLYGDEGWKIVEPNPENLLQLSSEDQVITVQAEVPKWYNVKRWFK